MKISKPSIEDVVRGLLDESKGFKYKITLKVLLSKHKENTDKELAPFYFNFTTKTVIGPKYGLDKYFQKVLLELITGLMKNLVG